MPTTYCIDDTKIPCFLIGEPGSGTESLIPKDVEAIFQKYEDIKASLAPGQLFEDPFFPATASSIAYNPEEEDNEISDIENITWLRPWEILKAKGIKEDPLFIDNGGDSNKVGVNDDVNQGQLGDCWFICSMAELSRLHDIFWLVVCKENVTQFNKDEYRGIFKFRFAAFARLIEVVIDDRIPFLLDEKEHWSVQADNPRVFWAALMEKAYAKLYSSYQAIQGGFIGDALQDFTGGVIDRYDDIEKMEKDKLWAIVVDAQRAGFYMGASIGKEFDSPEEEKEWPDKVGLANHHAYSLLTSKELKIKEKDYKLIRIRNPWGNAYEFKGKFNEETGRLYNQLDTATKKEFPAAEDGEFWVDLDEFVENFTTLEVINLNPFGSEGKSLEELCQAVDFIRFLKDSKWTEENCSGRLGMSQTLSEAQEEKDEPVGAEEEEADSAEEEEADPAEEEEADSAEEEEADSAEEEDADCEEEEEVDCSEEDEADCAEEKEELVLNLTEEDFNKFCTNPQIEFTVPEKDLDESGKSEVVISLLQRYRRNLKKSGKDEVFIGMAVAKIVTEYPVKGSEIWTDKSEFEDLDGVPYRSNTKRVRLTPGKWVVIPYTNKEAYGEFTVIVFTKK